MNRNTFVEIQRTNADCGPGLTQTATLRRVVCGALPVEPD